MAWNPPEGVDLDEVIEVAEEMGYLPEKSGQEYIDYLREDTEVDVMGTPERVRSFFNPQAEHWTEPMYPAMDMPGGPLRKPIDPADEWTRHIAVLVSNLSHVLRSGSPPSTRGSPRTRKPGVSISKTTSATGHPSARLGSVRSDSSGTGRTSS